MNITIDIDRAAFLPKISLKRPYSGWKTVEVSKKAAGTQDMTEPAFNAVEMVDMAVAITTLSSDETEIQRAKLRKTMMTFLKGSKFVWSVRTIRGFSLCTAACDSTALVSWLIDWAIAVAGKTSREERKAYGESDPCGNPYLSPLWSGRQHSGYMSEFMTCGSHALKTRGWRLLMKEHLSSSQSPCAMEFV